MNRRAVEDLRETCIEPAAREWLSRLESPPAELVSDVLERYPVSVISTILGLPPAATALHARQWGWIATIHRWLESYGEDEQARRSRLDVQPT